MSRTKQVSVLSKWPIVAALPSIIIGCGGGGGEASSNSTSTTQVKPQLSLDDPAVSIKIASILVQATAAASGFERGRLKDVPGFRISSSTVQKGCERTTYSNPDALPSTGDKLNLEGTSCQLFHAQPDGALSQSYRGEWELLNVGDSGFSTGSSWRYVHVVRPNV